MNYASQFHGAPERHHDPFGTLSILPLLGGTIALAAIMFIVLIVGLSV